MARRAFSTGYRPASGGKEMSGPAKNILITGAAKRIGRTIALHLAKAGWNVLVHYNTSASDAQTLVHEISALGRTASLVQADLSKQKDVERLAARLPSVNAFIHNASLFEHDEHDPDGTRHHQVNVEAPCILTEALFQSRAEEGEGSDEGKGDACALFMFDNTPLPLFLSGYGASRKALAERLPVLAKRYAPRLRLNGLALGPTLRNMRESEAHFEALVQATPLHRPSSPEDVAAAALFLLETASVTGQILNVDSGAHLGELFSPR